MKLILQAVEEKLEAESTTANEISSKVNVLQAIQFVSDGWRKVRTTAIKNCFAHCGFAKSVDCGTIPCGDEVDNMNGFQRVENYNE